MSPNPQVITRHARVAGRARFRIRGLKGSKRIKFALEAGLTRQDDVLRVSASPTTGNVLVLFKPALHHVQIRRRIEAIIRKIPPDNSLQGPSTPKNLSDKAESIQFPYPVKKAWHILKPAEVEKLLQTDRVTGLNDASAGDRVTMAGPNTMIEFDLRPGWQVFANQFNSLPVWLLAAEAGIAVFTGNPVAAALLTAVLITSAAVGCVTERTSEKTIHAIKRLPPPLVRVCRNGREFDLPAESLASGDVIVLEPGTYVAADCRITEAFELRIDQSTLTGESLTVLKSAATLKNKHTPLIDRSNMAYAGTLVIGGRGRAVVVATGKHTVYGRLQRLLERIAPPRPPLEMQLRSLGDQMVYLAAGLCGVVGLLMFWRGRPALQILKSLLALAASTFPTGFLPSATVNYAVGIRRTGRKQVAIRHLHALQTLGAVDTICFDKTGTITRGRINVLKIDAGFESIELKNRRFYKGNNIIDPLTIPELEQLLKICILCNEARIEGDIDQTGFALKGSPTEKALLHMGILSGIDIKKVYADYPLLKVEHRSETRRYMITTHRTEASKCINAVKGDPAEILQRCQWQYRNGKRVPLNKASINRIELSNESMSSMGLRVMGFAWSFADDGQAGDAEDGYTWLGLVGMAEPIRQGAKALMAQLRQSGIDTIMITGDQSLTAQTVARIIAIAGDGPIDMLDATQFDAVAPELLQALTSKAKVYTRVNPEQKLTIVQALQRNGKTVAMTGDGINDGPAMKAADIAVAMGIGGTDTARNVADVVLDNDNLAMLAPAVETGRTTFDNIRKSLRYALTTSFSDTLLVLAGTVGGAGYPLIRYQPSQVNLVADILPGLALALEPPEHDVMQKKPADFQRPILSASDHRIIIREATAIGSGALAAYGLGLMRHGPGLRSSSMAHQSLFLGKLLHALACRSERHGLFHQRPRVANRYLKMALTGSILFQGLTLFHPGLRPAAGLGRLSLIDMLIAGATAVAPHIVNEAVEARLSRNATEPNQLVPHSL